MGRMRCGAWVGLVVVVYRIGMGMGRLTRETDNSLDVRNEKCCCLRSSLARVCLIVSFACQVSLAVSGKQVRTQLEPHYTLRLFLPRSARTESHASRCVGGSSTRHNTVTLANINHFSTRTAPYRSRARSVSSTSSNTRPAKGPHLTSTNSSTVHNTIVYHHSVHIMTVHSITTDPNKASKQRTTAPQHHISKHPEKPGET